MYNESSSDVFCEVLVEHKKGSAEKIRMVLYIVIAVALLAASLLFVPALAIFNVLVWALVYFLMRQDIKEYEYIFTSGELDIDVIIARSKRKRRITVNTDQMEVFAPEGDHHLDGYQHGQFEDHDYSANDPSMKNYIYVGTVEDKRVRVKITPNEKLIRKMYEYAPSKVVRQ